MLTSLWQGIAGRESPFAKKRAGNPFGRQRAWGGALAATAELLRAWSARARERRSLAGLNDDLLRDLGISRADADAESRKPFWRP